MTASTVNGRRVMATEQARAPITDRGGNPVYYKRVLSLLLEDGTSCFGCALCDFTSPNPAKVRGHLHEHRPAEDAPKPPKGRAVAALARELDKALADRDKWKARAVKAERALATMRRALRE